MKDRSTEARGDGLTIGRVARRAGVNVETIRYYQRIGLVEAPERPARGYRHYPPAVVDRIRFIKRAQDLGFRLDEIGELLSLTDGCCTPARAIAEKRLEDIRRRIEDLLSMREALTGLVEACRENEDGGEGRCAIIEALSGAKRNATEA